MKNKSYYFSHDGNAHSDIKMQYLIADLGMEGYGIFWYLIESLFEAGGHLPMDYVKILAKNMGTTEPKVKVVIEKYDLFEITDNTFFSNRLLQSILNLVEIRHKNSVKGKISAQKRKLQLFENQEDGTAVEPQLNHSSTVVEPLFNKRKEKKRKEKKEELINNGYFRSMDLGELPENYQNSSIEQLKIQKNLAITTEIIQKMWRVFKAQNLTGDTYYRSESAVYKHFVNWLKLQKFENGTSKTSASSTSRNKGLYDLLDQLRPVSGESEGSTTSFQAPTESEDISLSGFDS